MIYCYRDETYPLGALTLRVRLYFDNDAELFYGRACSYRDARGPCYHVKSDTLVMGTPSRALALWEDLETQSSYCKRYGASIDDADTELLDAWLELRDVADTIIAEDGLIVAELEQRYRLESADWYNLDPDGNYRGESAADLRRYCEQDAVRICDYERGYWHHCGIVAEVSTADGEIIAEESCWGFESDDPELVNLASHNVADEALRSAERELRERARVACSDIATV